MGKSIGEKGNTASRKIIRKISCGNEKGLTLIEMLIYMGIFTILITVLANIFTALITTQINSQATSAADTNGRYILARLLYDIQRASAIITPATPGTTSTGLQITINGINYLYSTDNSGDFQIKDITDNLPADNLNGYDASISAVTFTRIGNIGEDTIQIHFTVNSQTNETKGPETRTFQTTVELR